jgi:hypothetical protein
MIIILNPLVLKLGKYDAVGTSETPQGKDMKRRKKLLIY